MKIPYVYLLTPIIKINLHYSKIFFILILSITILACSKDDENFIQPINIEEVKFNNLETEILLLVNIHRESLGLKTLSPIAPAYFEAINHTKYMIDQGKISHDNFEIRRINLMSSTSAIYIAENVAVGFVTAQDVVNGWLNSESHRKNIESSSVQYMSISAQQNSKNITYFTQIFIGK